MTISHLGGAVFVPYMKKIVKAGKTVEVYKYFATNYGKKSSDRGVKKNETSEEQLKVNEEHAKRNLRWLVNENFGKNDIHLTATYKPELRPDVETSQKHLRNMLRRFARVYEKQNLEFKYITVTEYKNKAIHHHLIINHIDVALLQDKWQYGKVRATYLDDTGDYSKLTDYLIKETSKTFRDKNCPIKKRWSSSRNLRKPKIKTEKIKASKWNEIPRTVKGYYIDTDSIYNGEHQFTGHPCQSYIMRKIE